MLYVYNLFAFRYLKIIYFICCNCVGIIYTECTTVNKRWNDIERNRI